MNYDDSLKKEIKKLVKKLKDTIDKEQGFCCLGFTEESNFFLAFASPQDIASYIHTVLRYNPDIRDCFMMQALEEMKARNLLTDIDDSTKH